MSGKKISLVVVGSIGLDTIETPKEKRDEVLGGSVSYACATASLFTRTGMVGVVGQDFPKPCEALYKRLGIDLEGLQKKDGKTFRWSGVYEENMNTRRTLSTDLNVLAEFSPELPPAYRVSPFVFLANIAPTLQLKVLSQMKKPKFVAADTMDLWINIAREPLVEVISKIDLLLLNDSEARELTGEHHLMDAARKVLDLGPRYVIVKKGEHGSMLVSRDEVYLLPAFPVCDVKDPTGAGDSFAGAFMGYLAHKGKPSPSAVKRAMLCGTVAASFTVEAFSLDRLGTLKRRALDRRVREFRRMVHVA